METNGRALLLAVLLAGFHGAYEAVTLKPTSEQRPTTPPCFNCPRTTTTQRTTTHSTLHTTLMTTTPPTTAHTNHTTTPPTTAHTNHTTTPPTTAHTNHTTTPPTTAHTNHTTTPPTTAHTNHTTTPPTTAHTNHTTTPPTTAHTNHTTSTPTTAHTNHTTTPPTTAHTNHTTTPPTTAHTNHTSPHTTQPTNHTTTPPRTTQPSNHTVAPTHPVTPAPPPSEYFVNGTSGVCLRIQSTFLLTNFTEMKNFTLPPPPMTKASGNCTADTVELELRFLLGSLKLRFLKDGKENKFYLGNITLDVRTSSGSMSMYASGNNISAPLGRSFACKEVDVAMVTGVHVVFEDIKVQAFELERGQFGRELNCSGDSKSKTVPIVVGVVLLVLIVIVVVAYLIARKKKPSGYERL